MNATPLRVAIVQRYFAHYRKPIFDLVAMRAGIRMELLCAMLDRPLPAAGIAVPVKREDAPYAVAVSSFGVPIMGRILFLQPGVVWRVLSGRYDVIVFEGAPQIITTVLLIGLLRWTDTRTVVWVKGWFSPGDLDGGLGRLRKWLVRRADVCLCYGRETRKQLLSIGVPAERIALNQNAVEIEHLIKAAPHEHSPPLAINNRILGEALASGAQLVSCIGRLTPDKRHSDLVRAFEALAPRHPGTLLIIAGDGPEAPKLDTLLAGLGNASIRLMGPLSAGDAAELFRKSDICVFPGAVGLALNEAMAAGCAVICADEPGPDSELCEHEVNGLRIPPGEHDALVAALDRLLTDPGERRRFGERARDTIKTRATPARMAEAIVASARMAYGRGAGRQETLVSKFNRKD